MVDSTLPAAWQNLTAGPDQRGAVLPDLSVPDLSVVVPAHNEAENILDLLAEIATALNGRMRWEAVVVDDCSSDDMPALLRRACDDMPWLTAVRHRRQSGQSAALVTGVRVARAAWVATLDGDGQNDPADIPKLWAVVQEPGRLATLGLVAGHRARRQDTWVKKISSRVANRVRGALLSDRTPDTGCGLKLFERQTFLELPHFDHMHRFLPALFLRAGRQVISVPVNHRPRTKGSSHYGIGNRLWVGIVDICGVMWLQRRSRLPQGVDALARRD